MQLTLWGDQIPKRRRKKNIISLTATTPFSITGNDCAMFGHTLRAWDVAGCTICLDCGANIFCPRCIAAHPQNANTIAVLCERHEESQQVSA